MLVLTSLGSKALNLDIGIYQGFDVIEINFKVLQGRYVLEADGRIFNAFNKDIVLNITPLRDSVLVQINHRNVGLFKEVALYGRSFVNVFELENKKAGIPLRSYEDDLKIRVTKSKLLIINSIDIERYVAGVVQAESGGSTSNPQFFQVQSVSCRTYALVNVQKHAVDGFHLCDEVHCQYYLGKATLENVIKATLSTSGEVVVDTNDQMINAVFHSNCGGQTVNAQEVWSTSKSYLISQPDSFCHNASKARWEVTLDSAVFVEKLEQYFHYPIHDSLSLDSALHFHQPYRLQYFGAKVPLKLVRKEFGLKSTYFETDLQNGKVRISGKGFGHGIGLCQQGAIEMSNRGYTYKNILRYYYPGTHLNLYTSLKYPFIPN